MAVSWLSKAGHIALKVLGIATTVAQIAEPEIDLAFPEVALLYNNAVGLAVAQEAAFAATPGANAQKLTNLTNGILTLVKQNGWTADPAKASEWASAVVDTLNKFPFAKAPATTATIPAATPAGNS